MPKDKVLLAILIVLVLAVVAGTFFFISHPIDDLGIIIGRDKTEEGSSDSLDSSDTPSTGTPSPATSAQSFGLVTNLREDLKFYTTTNEATKRTATLYHGDVYKTSRGLVSLQRIVVTDPVKDEIVVFEATASGLGKAGFCTILEGVYKPIEFSPMGNYLWYEKTCGTTQAPYAYDFRTGTEIKIADTPIETLFDTAKGNIRLLFWTASENRLTFLADAKSVVYLSSDGNPRNLRKIFDVSGEAKWSATISDFRIEDTQLRFDVKYVIKPPYLTTLERPEIEDTETKLLGYIYDLEKDEWFKKPAVPE